jgi:hypothetical protein
MNTWGMKIEDVLSRIESSGFKRVLDIPFMNDDGTRQEHLYVYFCDAYGIFLEFYTYGGDHVSSGLYHYQWEPKGGEPHHCNAFSSGGWYKVGDKYLWEGHGDVRNDMFENIDEFLREGQFVTPWKKASKLFTPTLVHWMDYHTDGNLGWDAGYELYKKALREKTPERFKMLPKYVQKAIENNMRYKSEKNEKI